MELYNTLRTFIWDALDNMGLQPATVVLERPADMSHGDFSTNVAMTLAKREGKNPVALAQEIIAEMQSAGMPEFVATVSVAGPGFINFAIHSTALSGLVADIVSAEKPYGSSAVHTEKKILVEHSSPNLFKAFHIGHMMNNAVGEAIVRLAHYSGADVTTMSYPSDVSLGLAKAVRVVMNDGLSVVQALPTISEQASYLSQCYVRGTLEFTDNPEVAAECKSIVQKLYENTPGNELDVYSYCRGISLNYLTSIIERLGSHIDEFIFESEAGKRGEALVREHMNLFAASEGAIVYEGEADGLHTRVFINSEGHPTYEAKDLGLMSLKFERYNPDISIFITDHEQTNYFQVVAAAAGKVNPDWKNKTIHRTHGRMTFKGQKMSSRLGGVPVATETLQLVIDVVRERTPDISDDDAELLAIAAIKFMILKSKAGSNINFDPETSLSLEGDTGPYLQYTVVRAKSVLAKIPAGYSARTDSTESDMILERTLLHFPSVVRLSIDEWAPHYVSTYLLELAQTFNSWYSRNRIIDAENPNEAYNIELTRAVAQTIENGMYLLGIGIPSKM
jgi:arginyl-tRNA synthetase